MIELLRTPEGVGSGGGPAQTGGGNASTAPDGGGASPSPGAGSTSEASRSPSGGDGGLNIFEQMLGEDPDDGFDGLIGEAAGRVPAVQPPPTTPPQAQDQQAQVPPQAVPQPQYQQPGASEASPQIGPQLSENPAAFAAALRANERALVDALAQEHFMLSREEQELLETDAAAFVPKIMAKAFLKSQVNMLGQMAQIVPKMIENQIATLRRSQSNENRFYQRWPALRNPQYEATINRLAQTYRMMNPQVSIEQMVEELGPWVMGVLRVPGGQHAPVGGQTRPNGGGRTVQMAPFAPAVGGGGGAPQQVPTDPWAILGHDD